MKSKGHNKKTKSQRNKINMDICGITIYLRNKIYKMRWKWMIFNQNNKKSPVLAGGRRKT